MMLRTLILMPAFFLLFSSGRTQTDQKDPLDAAFRVSRRADICTNLDSGTCAVIFSGGFDRYSPGGILPRPFVPAPDFFYLTGLRVPDAVLVLFAEPQKLSEGEATELLFFPGPNDQLLRNMGESWTGIFGRDGERRIIRPSTQWRRFCLEVLGGDGIRKVLTFPFESSNYRKPGDLAYMDLGSILYSNLSPGFPFQPQAQRLYQEISNADTAGISQLVARVSAYLSYFPSVRRDPILDAFTRVQAPAGLREIQAKIAEIKIDLVQLAAITQTMRQRKIGVERNHLEKASARLAEALQAAARTLQPGASEASIASVVQTALRQGETPPNMPVRVASGVHASQPYYLSNRDQIPEKGFVVLDFGGRSEGYCARITRTLPAAGRFSTEEKKMYEVLLNVHRAVIDQCRPGTRPSNIVNGARPGFETYFGELALATNRAGRGKVVQTINLAPIGLDLNELPLPDALIPGMALEVETAIYIPGDRRINALWQNTGIVLRDVILISEGPAQVLTNGFPHAPAEIEAACGKE